MPLIPLLEDTASSQAGTLTPAPNPAAPARDATAAGQAAFGIYPSSGINRRARSPQPGGSVLDNPAPPDQQAAANPYSSAPLATSAGGPLRPEVRRQIENSWDAGTPEQRSLLEQATNFVGEVARERAQQAKARDAARAANPATSGVASLVDDADPRAEFRASRLVQKGENPAFAETAGREGARLGVMPGKEVGAVGGTLQPSTYDFDTAALFNPNRDGNGLNNAPVRGLVKAGAGVGKFYSGLFEFQADVMGLDEAAKAARQLGAAARSTEEAIGERGDFLTRNFEGAVSSVAQQLPFLVGGVALGSKAVSLAGMAAQAFGQEYSDGKAQGQNATQAAYRASLMAALEVVGERFGLGQTMDALRAAARGAPTGEIGKLLLEALKREVPGELLTTTGQFAVDKFAGGGVGLRPNATFDDYLKQVADTIAQTLMQSGLMAGGTTGTSAAVRFMRDGGVSAGVAEAEAERAKQAALAKWAALSGGVQPRPSGARVDPELGVEAAPDAPGAGGRLEPWLGDDQPQSTGGFPAFGGGAAAFPPAGGLAGVVPGVPGQPAPAAPAADPLMRLAELQVLAQQRALTPQEQAEFQRMVQQADGETAPTPAPAVPQATTATASPWSGPSTGALTATPATPANLVGRLGILPTAPAVTPPTAPAPDAAAGGALPPADDEIQLQNRDRTRAASVEQMQKIARNPDYGRAGASRAPTNGAPMVFAVGDQTDATIPARNFGRPDIAVLADGTRVPFRYAVVDATLVQPSNFFDGSRNPAFTSPQPGTLKALNNARSAGLRGAYQLGTTDTYKAEMTADTAAHGVDPAAIALTPNPILVRVYSEASNVPNMGELSQDQGLGMSPVELAQQDAPLLDAGVIGLWQGGDVADAGNRDFVRAFVQKLYSSGQDIAKLMTDRGELSQDGERRINAAMMAAAYGDPNLVAELFDSTDTDIVAIGGALRQSAGRWVQMRDAARTGQVEAGFDFTPELLQAVRMVQTARRGRQSLAEMTQQVDLETGRAADPLLVAALRLLYGGANFTRARGREKVAALLRSYTDAAFAAGAGGGLFGDAPTALQTLQALTASADGDANAAAQAPDLVTPGARPGAGPGAPPGVDGGELPGQGAGARPGAGDDGPAGQRPGAAAPGPGADRPGAGSAGPTVGAGAQGVTPPPAPTIGAATPPPAPTIGAATPPTAPTIGAAPAPAPAPAAQPTVDAAPAAQPAAGAPRATLVPGASRILRQRVVIARPTAAQTDGPYGRFATGEYIVSVQQFEAGPGVALQAVLRQGSAVAVLTAPSEMLEGRSFPVLARAAADLFGQAELTPTDTPAPGAPASAPATRQGATDDEERQGQEAPEAGVLTRPAGAPGQTPGAPADPPALTTQTEQELRDKAQREEAARKAEAEEQRRLAAAQAAERRRREKAEADQRAEQIRRERADAAADDFQLGQEPPRSTVTPDELAGQEDIFGDAPAAPDTFIKAPDGSIDFGEITPEMGRAMRRQAGKIRLTQGVQNPDGTGHGLAHIEANHGDQIRSLGFASVQDFVKHVASRFSEVWQASGSQLLVTVKDGRKDVMFVQLDMTPEGDFYRVNSAFPVRQRDYEQRRGMRRLWGGSEPAPSATGPRTPFAAGNSETSSGASPNAEGQSTAETVAPASAPAQAASPSPPKQVLDLAADVGGRVVWWEGDLALIEGFSVLGGDSVYVGVKGGSRTRVDIEGFTGNWIPAEDKEKMLQARTRLVTQAREAEARNPDGVFSGGQTLVFADDIDPRVADVIRGWVPLLGLEGVRIVVTTPQSGARMADTQVGRFRRIGRAQLDGPNTAGVMQPLGGNDFHIALRPAVSRLKTLETAAHELGHIAERVAFGQAGANVQAEIRAEHARWLESKRSGPALDMARAMRAYRSGRSVGDFGGNTGDQTSAYWRSFGEWFADQVARWATTQDKPLGVVDRFFKRLADRLRTFFLGERSKFLPTASVTRWLDSLAKDVPPAADIVDERPSAQAASSTPSDQPASLRDRLAALQPRPADGTSRAVAGGQIGINGFEYKGGQFLPSTELPPGTFRDENGNLRRGTTSEEIEPFKRETAPSPTSRSIYSLINAYTSLRDGRLGINQGAGGRGIRDAAGNAVTPETKVRPGIRGLASDVEFALQELVDLYNAGARWIELDPQDRPSARADRAAASDRGLAQEEAAAYQINNPGANYDLFPDELTLQPAPAPRVAPRPTQRAGTQPAPAGNAAPAVPVVAVRESPTLPGVYQVTSQLVQVGVRDLPVAAVRSWQNAVDALQAMGQYAVEHFDALITDKDGKPLAVVGAFKGAVAEARVYPQVLLAEALRIKGAALAWGVHNHPSGSAELSEADVWLSGALANVFRDTTVRWRGVAAVGNTTNRWSAVSEAGDRMSGEVVTGRPAVARVPVVERTVRRLSSGLRVIGPSDAKGAVAALAGPDGDAGVVLLDNGGQVAGWVPMPVAQMAALTGGGGRTVTRLLNSVSMPNASRAILHLPIGAQTGAARDQRQAEQAAQNMANALDKMGVRLVDAVVSLSAPTLAEADALPVGWSGAPLYDISTKPAQAAQQTPADTAATLTEEIAHAGYPTLPVPRVQAARNLRKLVNRLTEGEISETAFVDAVRVLSNEMAEAAGLRMWNRMATERQRGPDLVREKLLAARRREEIDPDGVEFALWALGKNPALAAGLGISVRTPGEAFEGTAGDYNPAREVMRLFKGQDNEQTAVHEILHHAERMMPAPMQARIRRDWARALARAVKTATPEQREALALIGPAMAGDSAARRDLMRAFRDGPLTKDAHYHLVNPSEFWAVNAAGLLWQRFDARDSGYRRVLTWMREMLERVKSLLGLRANGNVLRALDDLLNPERNDGQARSSRLLQDVMPGDTLASIEGAGPEGGLRAADVQSVVDTVSSRWAVRPPVVVVQSLQDPRVPQAVRDEDTAQRAAGATGTPGGFFYEGAVYLVGDGLGSITEAMQTLFHEVLGHFGLRAVFGKSLNGILDMIGLARPDLMRPKAAEYGKVLTLDAARRAVNTLRMEAGTEPLSGAALDASAMALLRRDRREVAEEVLASISQTSPELGFVKRAVAAIRTWLRENVPALRNLRLTDEEIIRSYILPARGFVERGSVVDDLAADKQMAFSRSATKSVAANIDRGLRALAQAITDRTTVHRAMFRNGMGWVDFVWGDQGVVKPSGKTVGGRGLSHIVEARMRKDGLTQAEAIGVLSEMVRAIAAGKETKRVESGGSIAIKVEHDGYRVALVKNPGANAWVITAFEIGPDARPAGYATAAPTQTAASLSRDGLGAGPVASGADLPSLGGATLRDSTQRGGPKGAESDESVPYGADGVMFSRNSIGPNPPPQPGPAQRNRWHAIKQRVMNLTSMEAWDTLRYKVQDRFIDLQRVQERIKALGGTITDLNDMRLGEELFHKRLAVRTESFLNDELRPLLQALKDKGVPLETFEEFLHARHAAEANAAMAKRNPSQKEIDALELQAEADLKAARLQLQRATAQGGATQALEDAVTQHAERLAEVKRMQAFPGTEDERLSLSGMSDAQAAAVMAGLSPQQRTDLDALAAQVDAINTKTVDTLVSYGLIDRQTATAWRQAYKHYIPLHRDEAHPESKSHPIGQGYNVRGAGVRERVGSNQKVTNILTHIAMQREAALTRGEKNLVLQRLYLLVGQNPMRGFWRIGNPPMNKTIDPVTGTVRRVIDGTYRNEPNVVTLRIAGKDTSIIFERRDPRAERLATAIKSADIGDLGWVSSQVGKGTRWFASVNTQYNPIFGVINMVRDVGAAALNLSTTPLAGKELQVLRGVHHAMRAVYRQERGKGAANATNAQWVALWKDLQEVGGTTGYRDLFGDIEDRAKGLQKEIEALERGQVSRAAHAVVDWLSDYNEAMENAVRVSAYKAALEQGMSKERAASLAKNLTVNFNRKGQKTRDIGAWYAFFNAAVQGTTRMVETLTGPAGRKIMAGGVALGAVNALVGMAFMGGFGDDEEDNWSKIPDFVKERSLVIPVSSKDYLAIPLPLGFNFLPNIGRLAVEFAFGGAEKTAGKQLGSLMGVMLDAFNPLGGAQPAAQMVAPTVIDPVVALLENKDWTGRPIYREDRSPLDPQPGTALVKDTASPVSKGIAAAINAITGGTKYTPGAWSPTPDQIDYVFGQLTGGLGREINKAVTTAASPVTGDEVPLYKLPLIGRVVGTTRGASGQSEKFYENVKEINKVENELRGRARNQEDVAGYQAEEPLAQLAGAADRYSRRVSKLRQLRRDLNAKEPPGYREDMKRVDADIEATMRDLNARVRAVQRGVVAAAVP